MNRTVYLNGSYLPENEAAASGVRLKSVDDIRWTRRDIKSVNLLGQVLRKLEDSLLISSRCNR